MSFLRSKLGKAAMVAVVLLGLFLVRPGAGRLRTQIASSISLALGRPVEISAVTLRLLPRPGFDLENFVVHEDPAFGSEPTLRAAEVTASLRLSSLLRGRLEIARLVLTEPSVNLVRDSTGHWNLENLLERADKTLVAPTSKNKSESRPGFPYIEAVEGRINFKVGQEKKPYALTNSDFSIWQDSENTWGMRLRAQPVRTDFDLSDTGIVRVNGSWQRAGTLSETPLQFTAQWERAQLGQVTKLAFGRDLGWRGTIGASLSVSGTPADLVIATSDSVEDFRRYDLPEREAMRLAVQCGAHYSSLNRSLPKLSCQAPVGGGFLRLDGSVESWHRSYDVALIAQNVPLQALVALAQHAKKDIPEDLVATGTLDAAFKFKRANLAQRALIEWTGRGQMRSFAIGSASAKTQLTLDEVPFAVFSGAGNDQETRGRRAANHTGMAQFATVPHVEIGPFNLALGSSAPAVVRAYLSTSDYSLQIAGDTQIRRLLQLSRSIGVPALQPAAEGLAKVDLQIAGPWSAFAAARAMGNVQLQSVRAEIRGLNEPLQISSANMVLAADGVAVKNITASLAGTLWRGSLDLPRQCAAADSCLLHFDLHGDALATDTLSQLLNPHPVDRPWYRLLSLASESRTPYLLTVRASGRIALNRVAIHKLVASRVSANVEMENGIVKLSDLRGEVLGGKHVGDWQADFSGAVPEYSGSGSFQRVALNELAQTMDDDWITGSGSAAYVVSASGFTADDLISSAHGSLNVEAFAGTLPHIALADGGEPLSTPSFTGRLLLSDRHFEIQDGKLASADGIYEVTGTASLTRVLDVKLVRTGTRGYSITGPLTEPRVTEAVTPATRAALKP